MRLEPQLEALGTAFCFDCETALAPLCFQPDQLRLLQFHSDTASFWLDWPRLTPEERQLLRSFFARKDLEVYGQALAFDYRVLYANGIEIRGQLFDTYIASSLLHNGKPKISHSLKEIARRELGVVISKELQAQDWMNAELNEADIAYAMGDVKVTWDAAHCLHEKIAANGLEAVYRLECALIPSVVSMEHHGIRLDPEAIAECTDFYQGEVQGARLCLLETLDGRLQNEGHAGLPRDEDGTYNTRVKATGRVRDGTKREPGFNLNSPLQMLAYFHQLGIEPVDDAKKATLDKKVLARFQSDELVRMLLFYKRVEKRLGMAQKLQEHTDADGRIRARFMPLATGTGRFSSSSPNLQQIPRDPEFRGAFRPEPGRVLVQADYSAMELRVAAAIANEQHMIDAFNEDADIHRRTAALMFGIAEQEVSKEQRQQAKAVNFGALYGSSARGVAGFFSTLGMFITEAKARELLRLWHAAYPAFGRWHRQCQERATRGEAMRTLIGRRRYLYGEDNRLTTQANNIVQGTSADIMKAALVEIYRKLPPRAYLVACVHDEVLVECDEADGEAVLAIVQREMQQAAVPILGDKIAITAEGGVLQSWGDK